jgi:hypothetical protein
VVRGVNVNDQKIRKRNLEVCKEKNPETGISGLVKKGKLTGAWPAFSSRGLPLRQGA